MQRTALVLALALGASGVCHAVAPEPALAQAKKKARFQVGETVEVQTDDGRWYRATVQRVKGAEEYLLHLEGFPKGSDAWFKDEKVRAAGGGEIVDPEYVKANFALREKFGISKKLLEQEKWGDAEWESTVLKMIESLEAETNEIERRWPRESTKPMREGIAFRKEEYEKKHKVTPEAAPAPITAEEAAAMEAFYRPFYEHVKTFPYDISGFGIADRPEMLEKLDLASLEKRLAEDTAKHPHIVRYYGIDEKGKDHDRPYGGQKKPEISDENLKKVHETYLKEIFRAKRKLALAEQKGELEKAVEVAMERGRTEEEAKHAVRVAKAVKGCFPGYAKGDELIARAEANVKKVAEAIAAAAKPKEAPKPKPKKGPPPGKLLAKPGASYPSIPDPKGTNVVWTVIKGSTRAGFRENKLCEVEEGQPVIADVEFDDAVKAKFDGKRVTFTVRLKGGDDLLAEKSWEEDFAGNNSVMFYPVPQAQLAPWPHWSGAFAAALDRLAPGTHGLTLTLSLDAGADHMDVGRGAIRFVSKGTHAYKSVAAEIATMMGEEIEGLGPVESGVTMTVCGGSKRGAAAKAAFKPGEFIFAHVSFPGPILDSLSSEYGKRISFVLRLSEGGREIGYHTDGVRDLHLHRERSAGKAGFIAFPVVSNPAEDNYNYSNNMFNTQFAPALAALPPGAHTLTLTLEASAQRIKGKPLASATFTLDMTADGKAVLEANAAAVKQASTQRGGEVIVTGLRAEGPNGWKITVENHVVSCNNGGGKFHDRDFVSNLAVIGKRGLSATYTPSGGATITVKRGEGGYEILRGERLLARIVESDESIVDREGKPWGRITNEYENVTGPNDLVELAAGLYHWSELLR